MRPDDILWELNESFSNKHFKWWYV